MPIEVTCQCGRVLKAPESAAGKRGRCRACGAPLQIPDVVIALEVPDDDLEPVFAVQTAPVIPLVPVPDDVNPVGAAQTAPAIPLAPVVPVPPQLTNLADDDDDDDDEPRLPREPWYYGFLEVYAILCLVLGVGQFGFFFLNLLFFTENTGHETRSLSGMSLVTLGFSFAWMVGIVLIRATVMLALDIARNLRKIRYRGEA